MAKQVQINDFYKKKNTFFTEKITYLLIIGLKMRPMAQKPAFLTYLMILF